MQLIQDQEPQAPGGIDQPAIARAREDQLEHHVVGQQDVGRIRNYPGSVRRVFLADPDVKGLAIDVDTKDGVVTLNGSADKAGNVDKAVEIAKNTDGVKSVENKLTVKP